MSEISNKDRLYAELVGQLYRHAPIGIAATLINSLILVGVQYRVIATPVLVTWFSVIAVTTLVRYGLVYRFQRSSTQERVPRRFCAQLMVGLGVSGVLWGSAGFFLFPTDSIAHQVFLAFVLGGMVAGAAGTFAIVLTAFFVFSVPTLLPLMIRLFMLGDQIHLAMGAMLLLFWIMMYATARRVNASTLVMFELNASLAEARDRTEMINAELKSEIAERIKAEEALQRHREHLSELVEERTAELTATNAQLRTEIEERARAQEAQRSSEQKYRTLVETISDFVWETDSNAAFTYASPRILDILGYSPEQILGKRFCDLAPSEEMYRVLDEFERCRSSGQPLHLLESTSKHKNGQRVFWESSAIPIFDESGGYCGCRGISRDITARKQVEAQLGESERKYRDLVENINDVLFATNGEGRIIYISSPIEAVSGHRPAEIIGRHFSEFIYQEDLAAVRGMFERVASGVFEPSEYRIVTASGDIRWLRSSSRRVLQNGQFVGIQGMLTDITYRKEAESEKERLEARLRQAQKMEALGTLAGGIAHDFNNILAAIIGYTEMMMCDVSVNTPMYHDLQQLFKAGNRAKDLVKQILVFSRMKGQQERVPLDLGVVISDALRLLRATLPATIEIRQNLATGAGRTLADPSQIHEILIHLGNNAAHAMEDNGGVLEVALGAVNLDAEAVAQYPDLTPGSYLMLTVSDTGSGMEPATLERVFDPYFTTKEVGKGSGLGLAVVHGIVRRHLGAITVQSSPGKGTVFCIYLPRLNSEPKPESADTGTIPVGKGRILFVDDEEDLVEVWPRMLQQLGYDVLAKTSGVEALEVFRAQPGEFDLVMTDFTMPEMTGEQLAREILTIRADMPIVLCTGFSEKINEAKAKELGITEFVPKPLDLRTLAGVVQRALGKQIASAAGHEP
jgi:PAS domain S-box-containing protein